MELELVSLKVCPYVQRSAITLEHKGADYDVTYIDLEDPPQWFLEKSPLGKVPILLVREDGGETVLFESAVINEFVDTVTPGTMISEDPLQAALDKGWIEFASEMLQHFYQMVTTDDPGVFEDARGNLEGLMGRLEARLGDGPFWHGEELSLVDAAFAPALQRIKMLDDDAALLPLADKPKLAAWTDALLATQAVQDSVPLDFEALQHRLVRERGGIIRDRLALAA